MRETQVQSLGQQDPLEKEMATHSSILAWRISQTVHGVAKELDKSERLNNSNNILIRDVTLFLGARESLLAALLTPRLPIWDLC